MTQSSDLEQALKDLEQATADAQQAEADGKTPDTAWAENLPSDPLPEDEDDTAVTFLRKA